MNAACSRNRINYAYLLLQLAAGTNYGEPLPVVRDAMRETGAALNLEIWSQPVTSHGRQGKHSHHRIFYALTDGRRDDERAINIAEGILLLAETFYGPIFDLSEQHFVFPLRMAQSSRSRAVSISTLTQRIESLYESSNSILVDQIIGGYCSIPDEFVALAIKGLPAVMRDAKLRFSLAFLCTAHHAFYVYPGQHRDAVDDGEWMPSRASELARWESAFQNSYKAVEALIGDPPKDESRFLARLKDAGVNPDDEVGYKTKARIADVIRLMNELRDRRAAHGSTPSRGIRMREMVEFQECARYIVHIAIERASDSIRLGVPIC